ncbi:MAG: hypothetical protein QOJ37_632, partial [Pseudonocardiales bacterium]|nr:hypothetical protein [Pseudonocardiales bacterium]
MKKFLRTPSFIALTFVALVSSACS